MITERTTWYGSTIGPKPQPKPDIDRLRAAVQDAKFRYLAAQRAMIEQEVEYRNAIYLFEAALHDGN